MGLNVFYVMLFMIIVIKHNCYFLLVSFLFLQKVVNVNSNLTNSESIFKRSVEIFVVFEII